jgi:type IV pilus assembly protein PilM
MQRILGLDIGSKTIKIVELEKNDKAKPILVNYKVVDVGNIDTISSDEAEITKLSRLITEIVSESKFETKDVNIALPEYAVFSRVIKIPKLKEKELASAIKFEAEQYIPLSMDEVNFDYSVVAETEKEMEVMIVAASKTEVNRYLKIVSGAGLIVNEIEPEGFSVVRAVIQDQDISIPTMIVKIGNTTTDITITLGGSIRFTRTITTAGKAMTRSLEQQLNFSEIQAEEYKRNYGLNEIELEGKVAKAILPMFGVITSEIKRAIAYYKSKHSIGVKRIILVGGSVKMPSLLINLASSVDVEVVLGNPWLKIDYSVNIADNNKDDLGVEIATAIGVSLKDQ